MSTDQRADHRAADQRRAADAVPLRGPQRRAARAGSPSAAGSPTVPTGATVFEEGDPAELIMVLLSGHDRDEPAGRAGRRRDGAHRPARCLRRRDAELPRRRRDRRPTTPACGSISDARLLLIRGRGLRDRRAHLVPDGDAPARGTVPRDAQLAADRRPAPAAARPRRADGRADPRAEQPGRRRGPRQRRAARPVRRDAQQARDARARRDRPAAARAARRRPGGGGAGGRRGARAHADAGVGARGRAHRLARRPRGRRDSWELAPSSSARAPRPSSSTSSRPVPRRRCSREPSAGWPTPLETELLLDEITDSVTRISTLVAAAKQYSHMDRAPFERADIHDGLKSTLSMLAGKLAGLDRGEGARPDAAAGAGLRRRAEPGVDQPDRQRGAGDGRRRAR